MLFWLILKGIIFFVLGVIALLLLLVLIVLFVPIHYKIRILYNDQMDLAVEVTWLLRIFKFISEKREGKTKLAVSVFGYAGKERNKEEKSAEKRDKKKKRGVSSKEESDASKKSAAERISSLKENWRRFAEYPYKNEIIRKTFLLVKRLILPAVPQFMEGRALLGFEDPSATGMALGAGQAVIGILGWGAHVSIRGDFEKEILNLHLKAAGCIRLWSWTWPLAAYALSKPVWMILKPVIFTKKDNNKEKDSNGSNDSNNGKDNDDER